MRRSPFLSGAGILAGLAMLSSASSAACGGDGSGPQDAAPPDGRTAHPPVESIQAIDAEYDQQLLALERRRLERLDRLAAAQKPGDAAGTYERLFRTAIAADLFDRAEPAAERVLAAGSPSLTVIALADLVNVIAEVDRGEYGQSLASLDKAVTDHLKTADAAGPRVELPTDDVVGLCDAYYQRLIRGAHYETARKGLQVLLGHTRRPAVKEYLANRLKRLEMVGQPAPAIRGKDLDGKAFDLDTTRGDVVLLVFWASWCLPCAQEMEGLHRVEESFRGKGFRIVGINLDAVADGGRKADSILPSVRRFVLDYNVRWPTLVSGDGDNDFAGAYGVTEIPANVLIARDGTIRHIDLVRKNLDSTIARAIGR